GEQDRPGLPRDTTGRALLVTVLAMVLDLLAPWLNILGTRFAPAQIGRPILGVIALLGLALTPLARPSLRRRPAAALLPLVVGAAAWGVTAFYWAVQVVSASRPPTDSESAPLPGLQLPFAPVVDIGLYLFFIGGGVLVYCGYRMLLEAARAPVPAMQMSPEV